MRITIKDIAKEFNIHHSTVSRALRNDPRIKSETAEKIRKFAKENGYYLNLNALQLRGSLRNTIALIVPNINHRFFSNIINYLTDLAYLNSYVISVYQSNENYDLERSFIKRIIQQNVAGVIVSITDKTFSGEYFKEFIKMNIPVVFFDRVLFDMDIPTVTTNNRGIMKQMVSELVRMGQKRIAHITGPGITNVFYERNKGYLDTIREHELKYMKQIVVTEEFNMDSGKKAAKELYSGKVHPDAIISTSFLLTAGIVRFLNEKNIKIPEDVCIAGFGDREFNSLVNPGIISIEQPEKEIALAAFGILLDQLNADAGFSKSANASIELESKIIYN